MTSWEIILLLVIVFLFIIRTFNAVHKDANKPLRKNNLNDLKETLPRTNKLANKVETIKIKKR